MKRLIIFGLIIGLVGLLVIAGIGAFLFLGGSVPEQASGPITAPELASSDPEAITFEIVPEESEARFFIDEVLRGEPVTVIGTTDQIAGQIAIDPDNPAETNAGPIRINARTFVTDSSQRNRAINNFILQTNQFEFIEFTPTGLQGLPGAVTVGQPFTFQATGDLTIRDVTKPVTFEITVTPVSETRLEVTAKSTIQRADYNLTIPSVPFVADVGEVVQLEIDFVATPS
jgi:polyisoprenoid-binding protein YceI